MGQAAVGSLPPQAVTPVISVEPGAAISHLPPGVDPLLGHVVAGRYLIHKKLGEGGMGAVYLATHNVLEKQVALKVLHGEFARKSDLVERFMQEAKAASRIRHENVIDISDFGSTPEGLVFFAMELLKGHDLHEEVARARLAGQLLPWERSKRIFLQICGALAAAHQLGIIHRDLKPENIYLVEFLGEPDFVKLLDFGIAKLTEVPEGDRKLTRTGMLFGTPEYMSPEQASGMPPDHRVDIYAMGCILFQLVTGRVPFEAESFMGVLTQHLTQPPPVIPVEIFDSIGAPRTLAGVIDQALAKDRNHRFATIDDMARAVRQVSGDRIGPAITHGNVAAPASSAVFSRVRTQWTGSPSVPEAELPAPPRSKLLFIGAIVVVAAIVTIAVVATRGGGDASAGSAGSEVARTPATPRVTTTPAAAPGETRVAEIPAATAPPPATPPAETPPSPAAAFAFKSTEIRLESVPKGADVVDPIVGRVVGVTPYEFALPASHVPRQFRLHHKDYADVIIQLVPDQERIEHREPLVSGDDTTQPAIHYARFAGPLPPAPPDPKPEPARREPTRREPTRFRPPLPGDSDEPIALKPDPSRMVDAGASP